VGQGQVAGRAFRLDDEEELSSGGQ
jgi:hypothetical protein